MSGYYDFISFQKYTIGYGALRDIRRITYGMGERYLILHDYHCRGAVNERIRESLTMSKSDAVNITADNLVGRQPGLMDNLPGEEKLVPAEVEFCQVENKVCSCQAARKVGKQIVEYHPDIVVAVGGAKCQDLVRAALHYVDRYKRPKLVLCPTVLSSNASATGMSVIYDETTGKMVDFWNLAYMPECQIVDTEILIETPADTLVSGIGDQVASSIEALHTIKRIGEWKICDPLCISHHEAVLNVLRQYSTAAVQAMKERKVTKEFEWICHALTRFTGPQFAIQTAFFSHILDEALITIPRLRTKMHGKMVGYGIIPEMVLFHTPQEIYPWVDLFEEIGIPVNLRQLGIGDYDYEAVKTCCAQAADKIMASRSIIRWTPEEMAQAVMDADRLVDRYLEKRDGKTHDQ